MTSVIVVNSKIMKSIVIENSGTSGRRFSRLPFRRSTGNAVSGHYFHHYFFPPVFFFSPSSPFLIEGVLGSKNLFSESDSKCPITQGQTPFKTPSAMAILDFEVFLLEGVLGLKNLFTESDSKCPITQGQTPLQTISAIFGPSGGHFGFRGL